MNIAMRNLASLLESLEQVSKTKSQIKYKLLSNNDSENILKVLSSAGYVGEPGRSIRGDILTVSLAIQSWDKRGCPIFLSWSSLFEWVSHANGIPEFIVAEEGHPTNYSSHYNQQFLQLFCDSRKLFSRLADYCEPKVGAAYGRDRLLFLLKSGKVSEKYVFSPRVTWEDLSAISNVSELLPAASNLLGVMSKNDGQDSERRSIMRSEFAKLMLLRKEEREPFLYLITNIDSLLAKYTVQWVNSAGHLSERQYEKSF